MAAKYPCLRNLRFLLYEIFDVESLTQYPYFQDHSREIFEMVLDTGEKMGRDLLHPYFTEMDRNPPEFVDGKVKVLPMVRTLMKECGEGGWIGAHASYERGGQQMPSLVLNAFRFIFCAANYSAHCWIFDRRSRPSPNGFLFRRPSKRPARPRRAGLHRNSCSSPPGQTGSMPTSSISISWPRSAARPTCCGA